MSKWAFFLAILGLIVPFASLAAVILGIVALATKRAKKGLALAGLIIGAASIVIAMLALLILPTILSGARDSAKQVVCRTNLKHIGLGLLIYATDNDGQYPATLEDLIEADFAFDEILRSPADKIDRPCSYFYCAPEQPKPPAKSQPTTQPKPTTEVSPKLEEIDPRTFIVCTFDDVYDDFRHVLRTDCVVHKLSEVEFQEELAKPYNAKFAAALKKAENP